MLIKPLWPLAEYAVNYDYIVENLCENRDIPSLHCDGKCYLAKQLAKESEGSDKNPLRGNGSIWKFNIFLRSTHYWFLDRSMNTTILFKIITRESKL